MAAREEILAHIRASLGRANATGAPAGLPAPRLRIPDVPLEKRIEKFTAALEKLNGVDWIAYQNGGVNSSAL
ncbi:MAG: hypothetical protein J0L64_19890, partial [Acidobacteria bacterium]|nr:hypothetical protein [Acidobacteriota bacterium]